MLAGTHRNSSPISKANESTRGPKCRFVLLEFRNEIQTVPTFEADTDSSNSVSCFQKRGPVSCPRSEFRQGSENRLCLYGSLLHPQCS
jgi:hypothetical protein